MSNGTKGKERPSPHSLEQRGGQRVGGGGGWRLFPRRSLSLTLQRNTSQGALCPDQGARGLRDLEGGQVAGSCRPQGPGLVPSPRAGPPWLCALGPVPSPLCASVSSSVKWICKERGPHRLVEHSAQGTERAPHPPGTPQVLPNTEPVSVLIV